MRIEVPPPSSSDDESGAESTGGLSFRGSSVATITTGAAPSYAVSTGRSESTHTYDICYICREKEYSSRENGRLIFSPCLCCILVHESCLCVLIAVTRSTCSLAHSRFGIILHQV